MKDIVKDLLPPEHNPVRRWRQIVFVVIVTMMVMLAASYGAFDRFGMSGFARAAEVDDKIEAKVAPIAREVTELKSAVKEVRLQQIEDGIFSAKESECKSTDDNARRFFSSRVLALSREYFNLAGTTISIPPCSNGAPRD